MLIRKEVDVEHDLQEEKVEIHTNFSASAEVSPNKEGVNIIDECSVSSPLAVASTSQNDEITIEEPNDVDISNCETAGDPTIASEPVEGNNSHNSEVSDVIESGRISENDEEQSESTDKMLSGNSHIGDYERSNPVEKECDEPSSATKIEDRRCRTIDVNMDTLMKSANEKRNSTVRDSNITNRFHAEIKPDKNETAEEELKKVFSKDMFRQVSRSWKKYFFPFLTIFLKNIFGKKMWSN